MDDQITSAIYDAVKDANQPDSVAVKLIKWLEDSMEGSSNTWDSNSYRMHLDIIFDSMVLPDEEEEER